MLDGMRKAGWSEDASAHIHTKSAGKQLTSISIFFLPLSALHLDPVALTRFVRRLSLLRDSTFEATCWGHSARSCSAFLKASE